jgi:hypothetical protein
MLYKLLFYPSPNKCTVERASRDKAVANSRSLSSTLEVGRTFVRRKDTAGNPRLLLTQLTCVRSVLIKFSVWSQKNCGNLRKTTLLLLLLQIRMYWLARARVSTDGLQDRATFRMYSGHKKDRGRV